MALGDPSDLMGSPVATFASCRVAECLAILTSSRLSASMQEIFDDVDMAITQSYTYKEIGWLTVQDRAAAERVLLRLEEDPCVNHVETTETVVDSSQAIHVSGKLIDTDFQIYL